ncbi:hypothetical protein [Streptomyces lunaelactis]|uniref:hypothetical protein n=1 Tax=Streptomyces lunaelactis TaxID=1535768 RepID=UPI00158586E7|nr:hypothetical protein [Streptomyces lunaelactis]NUK21668.1 hypothetical protein [Streptomyces lunaelactis]
MTSFSPSRSRRIAAAASVLTVITVAAGLLVLAPGVSLPQAWWPRTGQAFADDALDRSGGPCELIAGPAEVYCTHGTKSATSTQDSDDASVWKVVPAATVVGALVIWRRSSSGQGRR